MQPMMELCPQHVQGVGYRRKRRKALRSHFCRRKCDERLQRRESKTSADDSSCIIDTDEISSCSRHHPNSSAENIRSELSSEQLPYGWIIQSHPQSIQCCCLVPPSEGDGNLQVARCVTLNTSDVTTLQHLLSLVSKVCHAVLCTGNNEADLVSACKAKGGRIQASRGFGDLIGFVDKDTIRHMNCDMLCDGEEPIHCKACTSIRSTLRSIKFRKDKATDSTLSTSHTSYLHLTELQKVERLRNQTKASKLAQQQIRRLQTRLRLEVEEEGILLNEDDARDVASVVGSTTATLHEQFPVNSVQCIFKKSKICITSCLQSHQ